MVFSQPEYSSVMFDMRKILLTRGNMFDFINLLQEPHIVSLEMAHQKRINYLLSVSREFDILLNIHT